MCFLLCPVLIFPSSVHILNYFFPLLTLFPFVSRSSLFIPLTFFPSSLRQFKGLWYMMESFDGREECVTWNITRGETNGTWYLQETKGSGVLSLTGISGTSLTTATLTQGSDGTGNMRVNWPLSEYEAGRGGAFRVGCEVPKGECLGTTVF